MPILHVPFGEGMEKTPLDIFIVPYDGSIILVFYALPFVIFLLIAIYTDGNFFSCFKPVLFNALNWD